MAGVATPGSTNSVRSTLSAFPSVWINELQPTNYSGITDSAGEHDPWIVLFISGSSPVSLAGKYLSDDPTNLNKWAFPAGSSIAAGQHLVIWADGQPAHTSGSELHTSFRLNQQSGSVTLSGMKRSTLTA